MRLLTPRNPLVYPGGNPGFDPTHIAAPELIFSGIASVGNFLNLLSGTRGVISGVPVASPTQVGPGTNTFASSTGVMTFGSFTTVTAQALTLAMIGVPLSPDANKSFPIVLDAEANFVGLMNASAGTWGMVVNNTSSTIVGGPSVVLGVPYFVAVSIKNISGGAFNYVIVRLDNGQVYSGNQTQTGSSSGAALTVSVGGRGSQSSRQFNGSLCAAMVSSQFMSLPAILQWAQSPWDFWYPQTQRFLLFSGLRGSSGFKRSFGAIIG